MNIKEEISKLISEAVKSLKIDTDGLSVAFSNRPELCEYQCNFAMMCAKRLNENPLNLAEKIVKNIKKNENFEFLAVKPGFINVKVTNKKLSDYCNEISNDKNLGIEQVKNPRLVFFDYGGANVAKELHVGHLRSPIVGEALKRVHLVRGDRVLSDMHLGDYGLQMGLTVLQLKEDGFLNEFFEKNEKTQKKCEKNAKNCEKNIDFSKISLKNVTLDVLNDEYPKASKKKDIDENFKKLADEVTLLIQRKVEPYYTIYQKIRQLSVLEILKNYKLLNCEFDYTFGESDAQSYIDDTINIFVEKKLARESEGALVVDVAREGEHIPIAKKSEDEPQRYKNPMPPAIIKKYNGGDLYATTDIATVVMRNEKDVPDEIVYVTDKRQETHFEQVFRCCKLAGISPEKQKLIHISFGTMNGKDGKPFKTRSGEVVRLKDVVGLLIDKASEKLAANGIKGDEELARKIGVGAMKFGDLSNTIEKDYVFDIEKFLSFDGKTGPYIQYTIARINSILLKAGCETTKSKDFMVDIKTNEEKNIALAILKLNSAYQISYDSYSLNSLCLATFELASAFSTFYNNYKILSEKDEKRRKEMLAICMLVKSCLEKALWTLGIDSVEKM